MRLTENDKILSEYFSNKIRGGISIPYITQISSETGISISTISRYANRKGYYNFPEMRANINNQIENGDEQFNKYNFVKDFVLKRKNKKFVVATSVSCQSVGYHISKRLSDLDINCRFIENSSANKDEVFKNIDDEVVIFITISGQSAWFSSLINNHSRSSIIISMDHLNDLPNNYKNIAISSKNDFVTIYNKYENVRKIFMWADDILNVLTLEIKK